ncbi:hypothetical protein [Pseudomonas sp. PNPG3]|uniref:hypothetical protein n=1 Tax=Pseudomonas sp. PNPG3 TaxID=2919497 RepID=UPI001FFC67F4|nr:hypothetical protein [Pseudomonas sp. PNPG3]MCK2124816.1 hypothetical protein [Pseudomonas sp. PNPG3]
MSNALKLATSALPAFLVLLDFSEGTPPKRAFLLHVDDELISQTLARVNEMVIARETDKLHLRKIVIDFQQGSEIQLNDAKTFKAEIIRAIGSSASAYTEKKLAFLKLAGFDDGAFIVRFQLEGMENLKALVDATLGMGGQVHVRNLEMLTKRFGLEDPNSSKASSDGILEITQAFPAAKGTIRFRNTVTGASAEVHAEAYSSPLNDVLPESLKKIRFDCGNFDWFMRGDGSNAGFRSKLDPEQPLLIEELAHFLQILCLMHTPERLMVDLDFSDRQTSVVVKLSTEAESYSHLLDAVDLLLKTKAFFQDRGPLQYP